MSLVAAASQGVTLEKMSYWKSPLSYNARFLVSSGEMERGKFSVCLNLLVTPTCRVAIVLLHQIGTGPSVILAGM